MCENIKLLIIGDGSFKTNLMELTLDLNIENNVIFTGQIPHEDVSNYLSIIDIGISHLPKTFAAEVSSPMKIPEYLSCGVPVLGSNVWAHQQFKRYTPYIHLYENTIQSFCQNLDICIKNIPDKKLVCESFKRLTLDFGPIAMEKKHVEFYKKIME